MASNQASMETSSYYRMARLDAVMWRQRPSKMTAKLPTGKTPTTQTWARWRPSSRWKETTPHTVGGPRLEQLRPSRAGEGLTNNLLTESPEDLWLDDPK